MADWPSIDAPHQAAEQIYRPQVRSEAEGGYVVSRPRATRTVRRWRLSWGYLSATDWETLVAFFEDNQGGSFNWTHPATSTVYVCRFAQDTIDAEIPSFAGHRNNVRVDIEEV